ncbi:hypothetical protein [Streptomyces sp. NPDC015131]
MTRGAKPMDIVSYYYAYKDGKFVAEVKLTSQSKRRYEDMGWEFKRRK